MPFNQVRWDFAQAEGEGLTDLDDWRAKHRAFFEEDGVEVGPDATVVCVRFRYLGDEPA